MLEGKWKDPFALAVVAVQSLNLQVPGIRRNQVLLFFSSSFFSLKQSRPGCFVERGCVETFLVKGVRLHSVSHPISFFFSQKERDLSATWGH